ncbi:MULTISPECIES: TadE/TadG family type IV pilus assembly protein [unclassified Rhizobium]|uniref:vWA domain-containing protein n=2 Tax=Rhizobium TaxID=379 RepID=UPI00161D9C3A|nr:MULTISPECIES: TadE/TadG family type IV pilus assembly protein [unclassified Rhizobium]MCS4092423.1 Flp pilus assembly protein TadG [Rhizobium sp. BK176]
MMSTFQGLKSSLSRLQKDRSGNFGMVTAIVVPVLIGTAGVAIDFSNMVLQQRQLQEASDAAALAAATALAKGTVADGTAAEALAKDFVVGQMANYMSSTDAASLKNSTTASVTTTTTATSKSYKVKVDAAYAMSLTPLMNVLGKKTVNIATSSSTSSGTSEVKSALSMTLALDESGSMLADTTTKLNNNKCDHYNTSGTKIGSSSPCYVKKIDALKTAANLLLDQLDKADPTSKYARTNAIGWSSKIQVSSKFAWGTSQTRNSVINVLSAGGGTESAAPMKAALDGLTTTGSTSETQIQQQAGNEKLTKYIVLMTDGENNASSSDTKTLEYCTDAKQKGIKIYSVAFMAPTAGKNLLLSCASGAGYYFQAESMTDLLGAFTAIGSEAASDKVLVTQ